MKRETVINDKNLLQYKLDFIENLTATCPKRGINNIPYSSKTISEYEYDIEMFLHYIENSLRKNDIDSLEIEDLQGFADSLNISPRTANRKISCVKTFFKFLKKQKLIKYNIASDLEFFQYERKERKHLTEDQFEDLLNSFFKQTHTNALRNFTIFYLLNVTGIRVGELVSLDLKDVDFENNTVFIKGIEDLDRYIPLSQDAILILKEYIKKLRKESKNATPESPLFISERNKRISIKTIQYWMKRHITLAGLSPKDFSTHSFRHTFTTLLYNKNVSMLVLSKLLGISLNCVTEYLHAKEKDYSQEIAKHPVNNKENLVIEKFQSLIS